MNHIKFSALTAALVSGIFLVSINTGKAGETSSSPASMKNEFSGQFLIGTALSESQILGQQEGVLELVKHQFDALTAENEMKWERIQPSEGVFRWEAPDTLAQFCKDNDIFLTGHTLVWHDQTPDWVFEDAEGNPASRELLLSRMETHISTVVGRYKGLVPSWDVVNEALEYDGSLRESKWYTIIGEDYIEKAFEFAHKADPEAELYYNDYNLFKPEKRASTVRLVKGLQDKGIRVDGIGLQAHYSLDNPKDLSQFEDSIVAFGKLGTVMMTELDLTVLPSPEKGQEGADISIDLDFNAKYNPYVDGLPADIENAQNERYLALFKIFLDHHDKISRVTFWGVSDAVSWRNGWPMKGRTDYPLLIDRNQQLKPVVYEIFSQIDGH